MRTMSKPVPGTEILKKRWFYGHIYLKDGVYYPDPEVCSLFVTAPQIRRGPSGQLRAVIARDVLRFANEECMVEWIEEHDAEELPPEADGNPLYTPEGFRRADLAGIAP